MESARPPVLTKSNLEGVERVIREKGGYAFLMESVSIQYVTERNCELAMIGRRLDSKGYGIAVPKSESCTRTNLFAL
jgi:ionotropic glutamate receptor